MHRECLLSHVLTISRSSCAIGYLRLDSRKKSVLKFGARFDYFLIELIHERDGLQWLQLREFIVVPRTRTYPRERGSLRVRDNICLVLERVSANHAREMRSNIARWTVGNVCARINVIPTGIIVATSWQYISYRCFRYNNFFWFVIRRSNRLRSNWFIWILYIFLRLCGDIAMTNEDLLIQFKKLLYNECTFIHLKFEFIPKIKSL